MTHTHSPPSQIPGATVISEKALVEQGLKLAAKAPKALQKSKALLKQELRQAVHFVIDLEARAFSLALQGEEAQTRIAQRLKGRK